MKKILALLVGVAILVAVFLILRTRPEPQGENIIVRLKWLHQAQFAGFYMADQLGMYRERGLNVDLLPGGVDQPAIFQVVSGAASFGVTGADQIILARAEGHPIKAVAVIYRQTPFTLFAKDRPDNQNLTDFVGKTVGVKYGGNEEVTYRAMLAAAGLKGTDFNEVAVKYDMSPFFSDQISLWPGYRINEPIAARERGVSVKLFPPEDYGVHMYADVLFTSEALMNRGSSMVERFVGATLEGWRRAIADPDQAATFVQAYNADADIEHEEAMMRASIPLIQYRGGEIGEMSLEEWEEVMSVLEESGRDVGDARVTELFTNEFINSPAEE